MTPTRDSGSIPSLPPRGPTLTDEEFELFQELIYREAGIRLSDSKRDLLLGRLAGRLRELGLESFTAYYRRCRDPGGDEMVRMLDRVSTNETRFFREPAHFDFLEQRLFPRWRAEAAAGKRSRQIRAWSCACASGEEPYSLAMCMLAHFPKAEGFDVRVLATDLSTTALARAERAVWPADKVKEIPPRFLKPFMLRGTRTQQGNIKAGTEIRSVVRFGRFNLNSVSYPFEREFELIFCRNVLIYFDAISRRRVLERLAACLAPGGLLFLGHAESASHVSENLRAVEPTIYSAVGGRL